MSLLGCGGRHAETGTRTPSTARQTTDATPRAAVTGRGALLRIGDLPTGWRDVPEQSPDLRCTDAPFRGATTTESSDRLTFEAWNIQEVVARFRSDAASRQAFAHLNTPQALACLLHNVRRRIAEEQRSPATAPKMMRTEPLARDGRAFRFVSRTTREFGTVKSFIDAVHLRAGRRIAALLIVAGNKPLDEALYQDVVDRIGKRLRGPSS